MYRCTQKLIILYALCLLNSLFKFEGFHFNWTRVGLKSCRNRLNYTISEITTKNKYSQLLTAFKYLIFYSHFRGYGLLWYKKYPFLKFFQRKCKTMVFNFNISRFSRKSFEAYQKLHAYIKFSNESEFSAIIWSTWHGRIFKYLKN